jgi:hypothetical protein
MPYQAPDGKRYASQHAWKAAQTKAAAPVSLASRRT